MKKNLVLLGLITVLALPFVAQAQDLDETAEPTWSSVTIDAPFVIDPYVTTIGVGGEVDLSDFDSQCVGFTDSAPSFNLTVAGTPSELTFFLVAAEDTTLLIRTPDGSYFCDDDTGGNRNPQINLEDVTEGTYNIWGASYTATPQPAYLFISENVGSIDRVVEAGFGSAFAEVGDVLATETPGIVTALDIERQATFGTIDLQSGFTPDPYPIDLVSGAIEGSSVDLSQEDLGAECSGFATFAPDLALDWSGGGSNLRLFTVTDEDTTLIVRTPDGLYLCSDDFSGTNPLIDIPNPVSGTYHLWVGSYVQGTNAATILYISELTNVDPSNVG
ncbi:MAG: hypothetical protein SGI73_18975 [Chloroflexota bacterium]|nr:hypothetical protein [Chloroflexota bacterium]